MTSSWRALVRIGWRDARRHRASSVLIAVLVALPVLAVAAGAVLAATDAAAVDRYRRAEPLGAADAVVEVADHVAERAVRDRLPVGATAVTVPQSQVRIDLGGEGRWVASIGADPGDPMHRDRLALLEGRAPTNDDEIAVAPALLRDASAMLGDRLELSWPERSPTIVGIVARPGDLDAPLVVVTPDATWATGGGKGAGLLYVDLRDGDDPAGLGRALDGAAGASLLHADWWGDPVLPEDTDRVDFVFVAGGLALFEVALVVAAAVAVRARRQLRTLGLMSAVGATSRQRARVVVAATVLVALPGALLGLAGGVALGRLLTPLLDTVTGRLHPDVVVPVGPLVVALLIGVAAAGTAAGVPARSASRLSTRHALAARRPVTPWPGRYVGLGVATVVLGSAVAFVGAAPPANGWTVLAGSVLVVSGFAAVSPPLLGLVGHLAGRLPTTLRLVVRDVARHRARTGPAVAAAMAALALPIAVSTFVLSMQAAGRETPLTASAADASSAVIAIRSTTTATGAPPDGALAAIAEEFTGLDGEVVTDPDADGASQQMWVAALSRANPDPGLAGWLEEVGRRVDPGLEVEATFGPPTVERVLPVPGELVLPLALVLSAVVALAIVAVATALNLYEARNDLQTLRAVGASPRLRWRFAMAQGALLAGLGAVLAIPAGAVPAGAVIASREELWPAVPRGAIVTAIVVVPGLAAILSRVLARTMPLEAARRLT